MRHEWAAGIVFLCELLKFVAGDFDVFWEGDGMGDGLGAATVGAHEGHGGCEDCAAALAGLDLAGLLVIV